MKVFETMAQAQRHTFLILTKRAQQMRELVDELYHLNEGGRWKFPLLQNVWLGVSIEDQKTADERIPQLLDTVAAVHFVSAEPLLGPIDLTMIPMGNGWRRNALSGYSEREGMTDYQAFCARLNWVICGGESGENARPLSPQWVRRLRDQCLVNETPFFFKQWGEWAPELPEGFDTSKLDGNQDTHGWWWTEYKPEPYPCAVTMYRVGKKRAGRVLDGREWNEFPVKR